MSRNRILAHDRGGRSRVAAQAGPQAGVCVCVEECTWQKGSLGKMAATQETRSAMGNLVVENLLAHFAGRPLLTPVI